MRSAGSTRRRTYSTRRLQQPPEPLQFGGLELAPRAGLEPFERQARVAASVQPQDRLADGLAHALDLVLACLMQRQFELRGPETPDACGHGAGGVEGFAFR